MNKASGLGIEKYSQKTDIDKSLYVSKNSFFSLILKSYWLITPLLSLFAIAVVLLSEYNVYANLFFLLNLSVLLVYRKPAPLYLSMVITTGFYLGLIYFEISDKLALNEIKWLLVLNFVYGAITNICLFLIPFKPADEYLEKKETSSIQNTIDSSGEKILISDIAFIKTIIDRIEKDSVFINDLIGINGGRLRGQVNQSHEIMLSCVELSDFFDRINKNVGIIKSMSERAIESAMVGQQMLHNMENEISKLLGTMDKTTNLIGNLSSSTGKISEIVGSIENIADQTNLLALNATIEAARAGSEGHSFAVVAAEIGKLAEITQKSTKNVIDMIESIQTSTNIAKEVVPKESSQAKKIIQSSIEVLEDLHLILDAVEYLNDQVHEITIIAKQQSSRASDINIYIDSITRFIQESASDVEGIYSFTDTLELQSDAMRKITDRLKFDERVENPIEIFIKYAHEFLEECSKVFEEGIQNGQITEQDLFSRKYTPISGFTPPKFRSDFDRFTDEHISAVQEKYLTRDPRIDYFALVDNHGYCPTHNRKYTFTGSTENIHEQDLNRTKRIFNDPIGQQAAKNTREKYLIQMYPRDRGDFINDLSVPFLFRGQHWGAVRVGYTFAK
ncbi:MAG: methyl-accepting chemotaxis protein [Spirochaetia bacterium]|nr:methyl-accepting chemotaxis protein [Spirochaetia bacterium]